MWQWIRQFNTTHPHLAEIIRFVIVGGTATVIDYFVMGLTLYCFNPTLYPHFYQVWIGGGEPSTIAAVISTSVGFITSVIFNYTLSILFVFKEKGCARSAYGFLLFTTLAFGGLLINSSGMYLGYDILELNEWLVKTIFTLIVMVYNYTTRKIFLFKARQSAPQLDA